MADGKSPSEPPSQDGSGSDQTNDVPNLGPVSDPGGRDFGDSAGYGGGGSARDYREIVGEDPVTGDKPNPLDAVMTTETDRREHRSGATAPKVQRRSAAHRTRSSRRGHEGSDWDRAVM